MTATIPSLTQLKAAMMNHGVRRLYAKILAPNDNSKNQIYLGGSFEALNILPNHGITADSDHTSSSKRERFKAAVSLYWMDANDALHPAPCAQLILYPKYPEVRLSGLLKQATNAPSKLIASRCDGRVLFFGITQDDTIICHAVSADSPIAKSLRQTRDCTTHGVFIRIPCEDHDTKTQLITALRDIHREGWIDAFRLNRAGERLPCRASNCGGYTLEGKLGITPNSLSEPDYLGWEIKQHGVTALNKPHSGSPITLMTPEPSAGFYKEDGVEAFLRKFGYPDQRGRKDRINFGGIYRNGIRSARTGLTLRLTGYDYTSNTITSTNGGISLISDSGKEAATWRYTTIMRHWNRKHAQAAYIPSICRTEPVRQYRYGSHIDLGIGTDFLRFLRAIAEGVVYYDPGIKLEGAASSKAKTKQRSQFRIKPAHLSALYHHIEQVDLAER